MLERTTSYERHKRKHHQSAAAALSSSHSQGAWSQSNGSVMSVMSNGGGGESQMAWDTALPPKGKGSSAKASRKAKRGDDGLAAPPAPPDALGSGGGLSFRSSSAVGGTSRVGSHPSDNRSMPTMPMMLPGGGVGGIGGAMGNKLKRKGSFMSRTSSLSNQPWAVSGSSAAGGAAGGGGGMGGAAVSSSLRTISAAKVREEAREERREAEDVREAVREAEGSGGRGAGVAQTWHRRGTDGLLPSRAPTTPAPSSPIPTFQPPSAAPTTLVPTPPPSPGADPPLASLVDPLPRVTTHRQTNAARSRPPNQFVFMNAADESMSRGASSSAWEQHVKHTANGNAKQGGSGGGGKPGGAAASGGASLGSLAGLGSYRLQRTSTM